MKAKEVKRGKHVQAANKPIVLNNSSAIKIRPKNCGCCGKVR